jgi:hypothetical protein
MSISVAHVLVRHRMLIFVAKILWSTTHAPQNVYFGAPQMSFSLLVSSPSHDPGARVSWRAMKEEERTCVTRFLTP